MSDSEQKKKEWEEAEKDLAKLLGEEKIAPEDQDPDEMARKEDLVYQLLSGFLRTHHDVVEESNENRSQMQEEIDHLHDIMLGKAKGGGKEGGMRECEINALVQLRKVQADATMARVNLMDAVSKLISASRHFSKGSNARNNENNDLRKLVRDGGHGHEGEE